MYSFTPVSIGRLSMRLISFLLLVTSLSQVVDSSSSSPAATCSSGNCQLPTCFCAGLIPPSDMPVDQTPQMIVLTFDDAVLSEFDVDVYQRIFNGGGGESSNAAGSGRSRRRTNPNGCPIAATFYVSHNGTDYDLVRRLRRAGHELASHSITHRLPQSYWTSASYDKWRREIAGQRDNLVRLARLDDERQGAAEGQSATASRRSASLTRRAPRSDDVVGVRSPFLETGGDEQFRMMIDEGFVYDSSMMTGPHQAGAVWPFTLDYPPTVEFCSNNRCPKRPAPGIWELPLNRWVGRDGRPCAMVDSCDVQPISKGDALSYFWHNFGRFYRGNRAPFGIHLHPDWLLQNADYFAAFETFIDSLLSDMNDVYFVTASQVIAWMKDPQTVERAPHFEPWKTSCRHAQSATTVAPAHGSAAARRSGATGAAEEQQEADAFNSRPDREKYALDRDAVQRENDNEKRRAAESTSSSSSTTSATDDVDVSATDRNRQRSATHSGKFNGGDSDDAPPSAGTLAVDVALYNGSSLGRDVEFVEHDISDERGPTAVSSRRRAGTVLNHYVEKVAVYEEPIGQLAERPGTIAQSEEAKFNRRTSAAVSTADFPRHSPITLTVAAPDTFGRESAGEPLVSSESTTTSYVQQPPALFRQYDAHDIRVMAADRRLGNNIITRRSGGQMKSGPADEHTLEEDMALPLPPISSSSALASPSSSSSYLSSSVLSAAAAAPDKPNNDVRATLPAAVMSAAAHVTSSSSVAINTASWTATVFMIFITLAFSRQ